MDLTLCRRSAATLVALAWFLLASAPTRSRGDDARPADPLLRLAPPDAGLTIIVEDLRAHARQFFASPLSDKLGNLPAVRAWQESEPGRNFYRARARIATILGADFAQVRDGLLGEAFLLALRTPAGGRPEDARGLLLVRVPDRALLDRAVLALNNGQTKSGELLRVSERKTGGSFVYVREFRPGSARHDEFYAHLDERTFAWSNSEELLREVIERRARGEGGLAGRAEFARVRGRLPARALISAYVDPRFVERLSSAVPRPTKPGDVRVWALVGRMVSALKYMGAAVEWREGIVVHTEELIDATKLAPAFQRWAERSDQFDPARFRVPPTALAFATSSLDAEVLLDLLNDLVPDDERGKFDNLQTVFQGLLLGLDLRADVLPQLGPAVSGYFERPDPEQIGEGLPWVIEVSLARGTAGDKTAAALDNACRTLLAFYAANATPSGKLRLESDVSARAKVSTLSLRSPWAFAVADGRFALANRRRRREGHRPPRRPGGGESGGAAARRVFPGSGELRLR